MPYLDSMVEDYNHFFMDEFHSKTMDGNLKRKFVRYFAENKRLDKIVMEEPYAYGYWVNRYLQTGDTILLKSFLDNYYPYGRFGQNRTEQIADYYNLFTLVNDLNNKNNLNIKVAGIDVNAAILKPEIWTLKQLFEEYQLEKDFSEAYERLVDLESKKKVRYRHAKKWLRKFSQNRTAKEYILESKLKDELVHFNNVILNLANSLKMHTLRSYFFHPTGYRDSLMHIQYLQQVKADEVAFSQFGGWHMLLSVGEKVQKLSGYDTQFKSFTSLVNSEKEYAGKCLSINLVYGEKDYSWGSYFFSDEEYFELRSRTDYQEGLLDFRNASGRYSTISEYYQIAIFLNGRI
jgi:hypothetical protein